MAEINFTFTFFILSLLISVIVFAQFASKRIGIPQVVGELIAGILIGPSLLNLLALDGEGETLFEKINLASYSDVIAAENAILFLAEMAGLFLLFEVGLEVDLNRLKNLGKTSLGAALGGIIVPFAFGFTFIMLFAGEFVTDEFTTFDTALFLGASLTATSIGISIRVLIELGQFDTKTTQVMVGAAIMDDILALLLFSLVLGFSEEEAAFSAESAFSMFLIIAGIITFFVIIYFFNKIYQKHLSDRILHHPEKSVVLLSTLIILFFLSWLAGVLYLATIIGAFSAGIIIGKGEDMSEVVYDSVSSIARWLVPFFFLAVGLRIDLGLVTNLTSIILALILAVFAISSKIIGSGLGTFVYDPERSVNDALQVGVGMSPRGEVILLLSTTALVLGVFSAKLYAIIIIAMAISAIVAPLLLKQLISRSEQNTSKLKQNPTDTD